MFQKPRALVSVLLRSRQEDTWPPPTVPSNGAAQRPGPQSHAPPGREVGPSWLLSRSRWLQSLCSSHLQLCSSIIPPGCGEQCIRHEAHAGVETWRWFFSKRWHQRAKSVETLSTPRGIPELRGGIWSFPYTCTLLTLRHRGKTTSISLWWKDNILLTRWCCETPVLVSTVLIKVYLLMVNVITIMTRIEKNKSNCPTTIHLLIRPKQLSS